MTLIQSQVGEGVYKLIILHRKAKKESAKFVNSSNLVWRVQASGSEGNA